MTKRRSNRRKSGRKSSRKSGKQQPLLGVQLTLDQQLDILGYLLLAIAAFTILSFLSANHGRIPGWWIGLLRRTFGWGAYLMPMFVGAVGLWLVLRDFGDRLPRVTPPQVIGIVLGYLALLITLHLPATLILFGSNLQATAEAGHGGGYLGAAMSRWLLGGLGSAGLVVALITWWLIVAALTLGATVQDIVQAMRHLLERLLPQTTASSPLQAKKGPSAARTRRSRPAVPSPSPPRCTRRGTEIAPCGPFPSIRPAAPIPRLPGRTVARRLRPGLAPSRPQRDPRTRQRPEYRCRNPAPAGTGD